MDWRAEVLADMNVSLELVGTSYKALRMRMHAGGTGGLSGGGYSCLHNSRHETFHFEKK